MRIFISIIVLLLVGFCQSQTKQFKKKTQILFVFDASRSMDIMHNGIKRIDGAKKLFYSFIDSLSKDKSLEFALRMYGHSVKFPPGDCKDSKLIVPFYKNNITVIKKKVHEAKANGITPIEHSLIESANDFSDSKNSNIVIIITDGIEECGGDPCLARQKLIEKGIIFKPFIIGIGLTLEQIKTFECVGDYYNFDNSEIISQISNVIQLQKINKTTVQVNLFDNINNPSETDVNMTFYDLIKNEYKYNYIHTLNNQNNPDTLMIEDYPTYKVIVHTIPPQQSKEIKLSQGKHNIIAIDAPQGYLKIMKNEGFSPNNQNVKCVIRKNNELTTLNVQPLNTTEKYIIGNYDLEILTLPKIYIYNKSIEQSKIEIIEIPNAGILKTKCLEAGDGCIMINRNNKLEWVCNLTSQTLQTFFLQPGNYIASWRAKALKGSIYTIEKKFTIISDQEITIEFYK